jgi:hypothetical protein
MKTLSYSKMFLTGTLAGLAVRCAFAVPASLIAERHDCITGASFWVYNIGSEGA